MLKTSEWLTKRPVFLSVQLPTEQSNIEFQTWKPSCPILTKTNKTTHKNIHPHLIKLKCCRKLHIRKQDKEKQGRLLNPATEFPNSAGSLIVLALPVLLPGINPRSLTSNFSPSPRQPSIFSCTPSAPPPPSKPAESYQTFCTPVRVTDHRGLRT